MDGTVPEMIGTSAHITAARSWLAMVDMSAADVSAGLEGPVGIGSQHTASAESLVGSTPSAESRGESVWTVARATDASAHIRHVMVDMSVAEGSAGQGGPL